MIKATIAFILFQYIPDKLIMILVHNPDPKYVEFAIIAFRIYLMLFVLLMGSDSCRIFFQTIGKSAKSAIVSLSKTNSYINSAMIILGHFFGL